MYKNIGGKIKTLAIVLFVILAIVTFIGGIFICYEAEEFWFVMILGPALSYVGSLTLYGFGELVEKVSSIEENNSKSGDKLDDFSKRATKLEELFSNGIISEEEYKEQAIGIINKL